MHGLTHTLGAQKNTGVWWFALPCIHPECWLSCAGARAPNEAGKETGGWAQLTKGSEMCLQHPRGASTPAWMGYLCLEGMGLQVALVSLTSLPKLK